ncbi:MAG TPA: response regulator transcription factor [Steroidobacteraceae bacterium]|jgi:DNA-binding NarL/FixJ family response regulator|nr:response regulator transcription factor [Steroidobacteraceae bacterium]
MTPDAESNSPRIRVVIAEDHALVRRGMALLLSMAPDMECVGQACNGDEAVRLAQILRPDVVLMDLHMPVKGGVAATREITLAHPATQVLVLTTLDDDETVFEAVRAGAKAYLLKDASEDELLETIRALRRGESRLTPQIARKVMDQFRHLAQSGETSRPPLNRPPADYQESVDTQADDAPLTGNLTDKEERVLKYITDGATNREIAHAMALAEGTIKNYVSRIMQKLHANTRIELTLHARK